MLNFAPQADFVKVRQLSDVISVLRLDNADIRRHKRTFTCSWRHPDGTAETVNTKLKVMQHQS